MLAALRLGRANRRSVLVDNPLPDSRGALGGFAMFSGAKFSLPPAGLGLVSVTGTRESLDRYVEIVLHELGLSGRAPKSSHEMASGDPALGSHGDLALRRYDSIVLTPEEVKNLVMALTSRIQGLTKRVSGRCDRLEMDDETWVASVQQAEGQQIEVRSRSVFFGAGRSAQSILDSTGIKATEGKGLDLGVRLEFRDRNALQGLRRLGPDAKVLQRACRTFCLNFPGKIYRYPFLGFTIPGGVVAEGDHPAANVGLLCRVPFKQATILQVTNALSEMPNHDWTFPKLMKGPPFGTFRPIMERLYGVDVAAQLEAFATDLGNQHLITWESEYLVHYPLLDWHWTTYGRAGTFKSSVEGIFVIGDSSGHARGLLQAALSGWIAAEEYIR